MDGLRWGTEELLALGTVLDERPEALGGESVAMWLANDAAAGPRPAGCERPLTANAVQRAFEAGAGRAERGAEGAADGDDELGGGTLLSEDDYARRGADGAGGADAGGGGGDLPDGAEVLGGLPEELREGRCG